MTIKVGVIGAVGRMGSETCRAVDVDPELELAAQVGRDDQLEGLVAGGCEVAVDFTTPEVVKDNVRFCLENGIHAVVGTTGLSAEDLSEIEGLAKEHGINVFVAPNFALGAVLMMRFAAEAAPHFRTAEIIERHHENKKDAPSGTSFRTAQKMNERREQDWESPGGDEPPRGLDVDGIRIHSLRLPGSVAHQEVILGGPGETLTIRHDSIDRTSFMPGVLLAVKKVSSLSGVTVGLENLLE
jgi:4-hydroxy-tetrahydrodipicolinate reductase